MNTKIENNFVILDNSETESDNSFDERSQNEMTLRVKDDSKMMEIFSTNNSIKSDDCETTFILSQKFTQNEETPQLQKKRGRIPSEKEKKPKRSHHTKDDKDNILRKLKVHFQKFIDQALKQLIFVQNNNIQRCLIRKLKGETIQNVTIDYNKNLLGKTMKEFLSQPISGKYANIDENQNITTINKIIKKPMIANFLNMTFEEVYIRAFVNEENIFGEKFREEFNNLYTLSKFIHKLKSKYSENYWKKVEKIGKEDFINYYKNRKGRISIKN